MRGHDHPPHARRCEREERRARDRNRGPGTDRSSAGIARAAASDEEAEDHDERCRVPDLHRRGRTERGAAQHCATSAARSVDACVRQQSAEQEHVAERLQPADVFRAYRGQPQRVEQTAGGGRMPTGAEPAGDDHDERRARRAEDHERERRNRETGPVARERSDRRGGRHREHDARRVQEDEVAIRNAAVEQRGTRGVVDARVVAVVAGQPTARQRNEQPHAECNGKDAKR